MFSPQRTTFGRGCQSRVGGPGLASRCPSGLPLQHTSGSSHGTGSRPENSKVSGCVCVHLVRISMLNIPFQGNTFYLVEHNYYTEMVK